MSKTALVVQSKLVWVLIKTLKQIERLFFCCTDCYTSSLLETLVVVVKNEHR